MGIRITRLTKLAAAGLGAVMLFASAACGSATTQTEPNTKQNVPEPAGPINVVASINQWGSLAAELGGDDVTVTSIMNSTNVDAHDFEPKTSDVAKLSQAQIVVANGAGYDSWATKPLSKSSTLVSAASVMGAMEGDNPHLWFSKDARSSMASAITEAYVKALPSKKRIFQKRLKNWLNSEKHWNLGQRLHQNPYRSHVRGNRTRGLLSHGRRGVQGRNPQGLYAVDGFRRRTSTGGSAGFPDAY